MAETSKKRTVRIPLDYYKRPDRLAWWRRILSAVAVLIPVAWAAGIGWDFWSPSGWRERERRLATHGPLAQVHASWDMECEACHAPFQPIGVETWPTALGGDYSASNQKCQTCHAAGFHHARQLPADPACATCHHDHQGRETSLLRNVDQHCTECHANLTAHVQGEATGVVPRVTRFDAASHPEFSTAKSPDPGHLKFDHARHLTLGMASEKFGPVQTLQAIREPDRGRYEKYAQGKDGMVKLDCAACHQLARDDPGSSAPSPPPRRGPAFMLPVNYQNHCRGCHPLNYDPSAATLVMEHPLQTAEVDAALWKTYTFEHLKQNPALLDQWIPPRPVPGKPESPPLIEARAAIERKVIAAEKMLFAAKCAECHHYEDGKVEELKEGKEKEVPGLARWDPANPVKTMPTNVPVYWWRSASFTHTAHRGVSCRGCHEQAYPDSKKPSHQSKDVLLPTQEVCLKCHAPRSHGAGRSVAVGGAGFDCTECHRYHDGDNAIQGRSPMPVAPAVQSTIEQFLLGTPPPARP